jgi:hypothetical protein
MNAKRLLVVLIALSLMFGASCFAALWMDAVGRVSGWTGLPQYESKIPDLRWYGTLWESSAVCLLFIAAFVLGLGRRVTANDLSPTCSAFLAVSEFQSLVLWYSYGCWASSRDSTAASKFAALSHSSAITDSH